jgi:protein-S-isoprenylcysteine O-methyltransferase Ste14
VEAAVKCPIEPREARTSTALNIIKTLIQIVAFWGFFLWVIPMLIVRLEDALAIRRDWPNPEAWRAVGLALFLTMSAIGLYCAALFATKGRGTPLPLDTTTRFLVVGPYRWIRNPMAFAGIMQGVAIGLTLRSPMTIVYSLCGALAWHVLARPWEEADLERRFGEPYRQYRARVRCWVPILRAYPRQQLDHPDFESSTLV